MEKAKLIDLLNYSELKELQNRGKIKASFNSNFMFLQLWELAELYDYISFEHSTTQLVSFENDIDRAADVLNELNLRHIAKQKV